MLSFGAMVAVELDRDNRTRFLLRAQDRELYQVQQVPGNRWDPERRVFTAPRSWAVLQSLRGIFRDELSTSNEVMEWAGQESVRRVQPCLYLRTQTTLHPDLAGEYVDALARWEKARDEL